MRSAAPQRQTKSAKRRLVTGLVLAAVAGLVAAGLWTAWPDGHGRRVDACQVLTEAMVSETFGAPSSAALAVEPDGPFPYTTGCSYHTANGGVEIWALHQGAKQFYDRALAAMKNFQPPRWTVKPENGKGFLQFSLSDRDGPTRLVYSYRSGLYTNLIVTPAAGAAHPDDMAERLAEAIRKRSRPAASGSA